MRTTPTVPGARLLGVGDYRPVRVVTNDDLAARVETSDAWIRERTGIASRRIAGPDETVAAMGAEAAAKALAAGGISPGEVDLVLVATSSLLRSMPSAAAQVAGAVGAAQSGAMDVNAACAGFCYALSAAADAVRSGTARHVLVVGSERYSDILDWDDRSTCIIFADGAGAVVVGPAEEPGIGPVVWGSDGERGGLITVDERQLVRMSGPQVFRWATTELAPLAREACARAGVELSDVTAFVPHQANLRIIDSLARALDLSDRVIARDVVDSGNTSAASIPMALARLVEEGSVRSGDLALLVGFGSGLSWAAQVVACP